MSFFQDHSALARRHARRYIQETLEKIPPDDLAREMELLLGQIETRAPDKVLASPEMADFFLRSIVKFASGRSKRRRKLIEQIAAGDDLQAVAEELRALDEDLPAYHAERTASQMTARRILDEIKRELDLDRKVVFAFLIEDQLDQDEFPKALSLPPSEVKEAIQLIDLAAQRCGIEADTDRREAPTLSITHRREKKLRQLAREAGARALTEDHIDDPLLTLIRSGDRSDDLNDALQHLSECADCRARLEEGELERRSLVVMAIEAPRASQRELQAAAEGSGAILTERGQGRWTAVVDAERADSFRGTLERPEASVVTRLAMASPVEVPVEEAELRRSSYPPDSAKTRGTNAAEAAAWAQVAKTPPRSVAPSPYWAGLSVAVIATAIGIAYFLATR